jgi:hypothetical protein
VVSTELRNLVSYRPCIHEKTRKKYLTMHNNVKCVREAVSFAIIHINGKNGCGQQPCAVSIELGLREQQDLSWPAGRG